MRGGISTAYAEHLADLAAAVDEAMARVEARTAAYEAAKAQAATLCATKEQVPTGPSPLISGGQLADQAKRGKRELRHVLTSIPERRRKYSAETGFDMVTCAMVDPPLEQWARPEAMPLYWRLMVAGDATQPMASLTPGDQELARWMHAEELLTIGADGLISCLSDADHVEGRRYPGSPLPDPCPKAAGTVKCTFHTGPCPKIASNGGPYHAAIGKYVGPERARTLVLAAWSAIKAGRPYAQVAASHRGEMTRPGGIRISATMLCHQANVYLAQLKVMHPAEWADVRYMSTDVAEDAIKALLADGEPPEQEPATLTRIGHTEVGLPRTYAATPDEMAGWLKYAAAGNPRRARPGPRWLRRSALQEAA